MRTRPHNSWKRYATAVTAVALATLLTGTVPVLHDRFTLFLFWPVLLGVAWYGGLGPALVATLLSAAAAIVQGSAGADRWQVGLLVGVFAIIGLATAILARWREAAEGEVRESRERFATIANSAPVLVWMSGPDTLATYVNKRWLEFTGRALSRELGEGWLEAVHPDDRSAFLAKFAEASNARRSLEAEVRLRRADGEYRCILVRGAPRVEGGTEFAGYIGSGTDITDQREALKTAQSATASAEAASRAKDAFSNGLA